MHEARPPGAFARALVALGGEFKALGVDLVVLDQAIDTTTAAGRAMFGMLAVFAEFERDLIRERVIAGLQRAKTLGKRLGRPPSRVRREQVVALRKDGLSYREIGRRLRISAALAHRLAGDHVAEDRQGRSLTFPATSAIAPGPAPHGGAPAPSGAAPERQETKV